MVIAAVPIPILFLLASSVEVTAAQSTLAEEGGLPTNRRHSVISVLKAYVETSRFGSDKLTRYSATSVPNTGVVLAYLQGPTWCGSGGCTLLILRASGTSYKVTGKVLAVHTPIYDLQKLTNGLPELGVWVQGGGIDVGYEAILAANRVGKYPVSAAMSQRRVMNGSGKCLVRTGDQGELLFR
jgi:hypothetical protein